MNVALITAFISIMLVPMGTAWVVALGKAPKRIAYRQLAAALTVELVILVAIHVGFYSTFSGDEFTAIGFVFMYLVSGAANTSVVAYALEYIDDNHDEAEPPKLMTYKGNLR